MKNSGWIGLGIFVVFTILIPALSENENSTYSTPIPKQMPAVVNKPTITPTTTPVFKYNFNLPNSFNGYDCTEDCSGHEAGYEWAEENDIDDEYDCDGNSNSFIEGCQSYVEENYSSDDYYDEDQEDQYYYE